MTHDAVGNPETPWRILVVDDEDGIANTICEALESSGSKVPYPLSAIPIDSFDEALEVLERSRVDLLILDVIDQAGEGETGHQSIGRDVFDKIRAKRFLPIIFLTGIPNEVTDLTNPPFVQVVPKLPDSTDVNEPLFQSVKKCLDSAFPRMWREFRSRFDKVARDFMIDFVEQRWDDLEGSENWVHHLLARQLSVSLHEGGTAAGEGVDPIRYYVVPPPDGYRMGDIIVNNSPADVSKSASCEWYVILTPSCDLVERTDIAVKTDAEKRSVTKADCVTLAECRLLKEFEQYRNWINSADNGRTAYKKLERLLRSNPERGQQSRYFYLPEMLEVPHLLVDFQCIIHIPFSDLKQFARPASLDSPYAEALSRQFVCFIGRVGTPDLDLKTVIDDMRSSEQGSP